MSLQNVTKIINPILLNNLMADLHKVINDSDLIIGKEGLTFSEGLPGFVTSYNKIYTFSETLFKAHDWYRDTLVNKI